MKFTVVIKIYRQESTTKQFYSVQNKNLYNIMALSVNDTFIIICEHSL